MKKSKTLVELIDLVPGSSQFRITESLNDENSPSYLLYSQQSLREDLQGIYDIEDPDNKVIRTFDDVTTLNDGDIVFSLISGIAAIVNKNHEGNLYTQNYVKLIPRINIDSKFLVYCLNENKIIRRQLQNGMQGSIVMKHTLKQLKEVTFPDIPELLRQKSIGEIYLKQLRLNALRYRVAELEKTKIFNLLEEEVKK